MDGLDFIINLGLAAEVMRQPMTLAEAIDIVDPSTKACLLENPNIAMAKEIKARGMVAEYARKKIAEESENG